MRRYALLCVLALGGFAACNDSDDSSCESAEDCPNTQICLAGECVANPVEDVVCDPLTAPANGTVDQATPSRPGATATFACSEEGEGLTGPATLTCQPDGSWNGTVPSCQVCSQFNMTSIKAADLDEEGAPVRVSGFNLDGLNSPAPEEGAEKTPENGCATEDLPGGIDNMLGTFFTMLEPMGLNIFGGIADSLGNDVDVKARLFTDEDDNVTLSIFNGNTVLVNRVPATLNSSGIYEASAERFQLALNGVKILDYEVLDEEGQGTGEMAELRLDFVLTLNDVRFEFDPETERLNVGGITVYGEEGSDESTLRPSIARALEGLASTNPEFNVPIVMVDNLIGGFFDMAREDTGCDYLSIGMFFDGATGVCE